MLLAEEELFAGGKDEFPATVHALQNFVEQFHPIVPRPVSEGDGETRIRVIHVTAVTIRFLLD